MDIIFPFFGKHPISSIYTSASLCRSLKVCSIYSWAISGSYLIPIGSSLYLYRPHGVAMMHELFGSSSKLKVHHCIDTSSFKKNAHPVRFLSMALMTGKAHYLLTNTWLSTCRSQSHLTLPSNLGIINVGPAHWLIP